MYSTTKEPKIGYGSKYPPRRVHHRSDRAGVAGRKGAYVTLDQELVVLETDKVTVPVPSPVAGVLVDMAVGVDDVVEIGALLATVDETAEATSTPEEPAARASSAEAAVMPAARRLATETGVDTSTVEGTGRYGRVLKEDVQQSVKTVT